MKKNWVHTDHGWVDAEKVEFLNIEEGLQGDEMTFKYRGKEYKSLIVISYSRPG